MLKPIILSSILAIAYFLFSLTHFFALIIRTIGDAPITDNSIRNINTTFIVVTIIYLIVGVLLSLAFKHRLKDVSVKKLYFIFLTPPITILSIIFVTITLANVNDISRQTQQNFKIANDQKKTMELSERLESIAQFDTPKTSLTKNDFATELHIEIPMTVSEEIEQRAITEILRGVLTNTQNECVDFVPRTTHFVITGRNTSYDTRNQTLDAGNVQLLANFTFYHKDNPCIPTNPSFQIFTEDSKNSLAYFVLEL